VVAVSDDIARGLLEGAWAPAERLHTVLNGVDLQHFRPSRDRGASRAPLGLPLTVPVIGTVARLSPEKDQFTLLQAFARVRQALPEARLVIVGDGPLRPDLTAQSQELGVAEHTLFLGERSDVAALFGAMDVFCLPSRTEGTSLTLLEAMASGLPVVATAVGGTPEVVEADRSGFLVPPAEPQALADALVRVLKHPDLADRMGAAGRGIVAARYSLRAMVEQYSELYERMLL
jgi:glycosyltransferase involved in cell wall biosynthesis